MESNLSPQTEQYIAETLSAGAFPTRESLLEAAVAELRAARSEEETSLQRCEEAVTALDAGQGVPWDAEEMKRLVRAARHAGQDPNSNRVAG